MVWDGGVPTISCMAPPPQEEEVELRRMSVASSARGLGLGKRLVARVEQHAREVGFQAVRHCRMCARVERAGRFCQLSVAPIPQVMLSTGGMMDLALQLYRSCGYTQAEPHSWSRCVPALGMQIDYRLPSTRPPLSLTLASWQRAPSLHGESGSRGWVHAMQRRWGRSGLPQAAGTRQLVMLRWTVTLPVTVAIQNKHGLFKVQL